MDGVKLWYPQVRWCRREENHCIVCSAPFRIFANLWEAALTPHRSPAWRDRLHISTGNSKTILIRPTPLLTTIRARMGSSRMIPTRSITSSSPVNIMVGSTDSNTAQMATTHNLTIVITILMPHIRLKTSMGGVIHQRRDREDYTMGEVVGEGHGKVLNLNLMQTITIKDTAVKAMVRIRLQQLIHNTLNLTAQPHPRRVGEITKRDGKPRQSPSLKHTQHQLTSVHHILVNSPTNTPLRRLHTLPHRSLHHSCTSRHSTQMRCGIPASPQ